VPLPDVDAAVAAHAVPAPRCRSTLPFDLPFDPAVRPCRSTLPIHPARKEAPIMIDKIRQFVLDSLRDMNYSIDDIDDDTVLGPAGADVESIALAELEVRVEDEFGVKFDEAESELLTGMTVGEFCRDVELRVQPASAHG
jgi:acyl carrier protein